ncbi:Neurotrypsin, partial [Ophiophagus hannah]
MICDDEWTDLDASVVCQQLGLSETGTALRQCPSSPELLPLHLQSANCRGDEKMLSQCSYQEIFRACIQGTAGASCGSSQAAVASPLCLVGGKKRFEGRVEIYHGGHWGTICDDQWDDKDAEVVCRHLDLSGFSRAVSWAHFGKGSGPILLDEVECSGNELSLDQCKKSDWGKHNCDHIEDAGVICDPFVGNNAQVACRQLGFSGPARLASKGEFAPGQGFILLDDVACIGMESSLMDCPHSNWGQHDCSHEEDVGIHCSLVSNRITEDKTGANSGLCGLRLTQHQKDNNKKDNWWKQILQGKLAMAGLLASEGDSQKCLFAVRCNTYQQLLGDDSSTLLQKVRFGVDVRRYLLRVGDHHTGVRDESEKELPVEKILLHRNYQSSSNDNDIGLVRMWGKEDNCLSFSHHVFPVCLPVGKQKAAVDRKSCVISGWGDTGRSYSRMLLQGTVALLPRKVCKSRYGKKFTNRMLCAGNLSEDNWVDSCQGDSGGPLVCQRPNTQW